MPVLGLLSCLLALGSPLQAQTLVETSAASPAPIATLPPLLVGSLSDLQSPLSLRLDFHASQLTGLASAGPLQPQQAAGYLAPLREANAHPIDRLASGILARSLADPTAARRLLETYPALHATAARDLPLLLTQGDPYRGSPARSNSFLARLGREAARDPEVARIFDGEEAKPSLGISELFIQDGRLRTWDSRSALVAENADWTVHEHPAVPGAVIHVSVEKVDPWTPAAPMRAAARRDERLRKLHGIGAGPRVLSRSFDAAADTWLDHIPEAGAQGNLWSHPVIVQERVYGEDIETLMIHRSFGQEESALVDELLDRLAAAALRAPGLEARDIVIGTTAADPRRRALIVQKGVGGFDLVPSGADRARTRDMLLAQPVFSGVEVTPNGSRAATMPLGRLLEAGRARTAASSLWQRAKSGLRGLWSMSLFPEAK